MDPIDNNQFEVLPGSNSKRKITTPCPNAFMNPALDLLANDDPMCNTAMEIVPLKKRKRARSCDIAAFENSGLDLGISKSAVNEFLKRELENVQRNIKNYDMKEANESTSFAIQSIEEEPVYANLTDLSIVPVLPSRNSALVSHRNNNEEIICETTQTNEIEMDSGISVLEQKAQDTLINGDFELSSINATTSIQANITNQLFVNNTNSSYLSFLDRLALDSPSLSNQSLYYDDDLNESNIMEIKTITIITKKKLIERNLSVPSPVVNNTNPFLDPNLNGLPVVVTENPFVTEEDTQPELEYNDDMMKRPMKNLPKERNLIPRQLFTTDTNSTISTMSDTSLNADNHEYENVDSYRADSPIYENIGDETYSDGNYNKQSKILGHDVSRFSAADIMNLNKINAVNNSNESNGSKKDIKHTLLNASNKLSKKIFKTLKKKFKHENKSVPNVTLNPYEVPRKPPKEKKADIEAGIENPALNLDNSDEIEIEEIEDGEHLYEDIKTIRNTQLNMNLTPLRERVNEVETPHNRTYTPGKKVRFDSTLNQEKLITGNSFDDIGSPGFDSKIDKYQDELENCINERKFLQQNM